MRLTTNPLPELAALAALGGALGGTAAAEPQSFPVDLPPSGTERIAKEANTSEPASRCLRLPSCRKHAARDSASACSSMPLNPLLQ